ncbi:MAG: hypothetical protein HKN82_20200, partial [Akkermansiaceae bacterium]|nr:hypothetical protein [Akkermansiaceae bacterium]
MNLDPRFYDLVLWGLLPLVILYALYALNDCRRTAGFTGREKVLWALVIVFFPIGGGVLWTRAKDRRRATQSPLMRRVRA